MVADGVRLTCQTWTDARRPRETVRDFATADQAVEGFHAYRRKKMQEGFAYVVDPAGAVRGDTLLYLKAPLRCTGGFDLSPDARTLVTGGFRDSTNTAEIHVIDAATNLRRLVHSVPPSPELAQPLPHAVLFDVAAERVVFAVGGETRLLDLASGGTRTLAAYVQFKTAHYNPFRLRPQWDARRERLLVFDRDDSVRVLDPDGDELFQTSAARQPSECWAAGLSPSGKLLALCFVQGSRYSEDAPRTVEIEIWDVDARQLVRRLPMQDRPYTVGFDPADTWLVVNSEAVEGPAAYALETGELAWYCPALRNPDRWARCHGWAFSPDGTTLVVGGRGDISVLDVAARHYDAAFNSRSDNGGTGRTDIIRFDAAQTVIASHGDNGRILIRKL